MTKRVARLVVALAGVLAAGCATSHGPGRRPDTPADKINESYSGGDMSATPAAVMLAGLDTNQDQKIDRKELDAGADRAFESADTDHNGAVSIAELAAWAKRWLGDAYALPGHYQFDQDQNDEISRQEFHQTFARLFNQFDQNADGVIERSELLTMRLPGEGRGFGRGGQGSGGFSRRGRGRNGPDGGDDGGGDDGDGE